MWVMLRPLQGKWGMQERYPLGSQPEREILIMSTKVAQMTKDELRDMIETTVEQKLLELLGDPDEGLTIRKALRDRLLRQRQAVADGERGEPLKGVARKLRLE